MKYGTAYDCAVFPHLKEVCMEIEKIVSIEQLSGEQKEIAETIGLESYRKLVKNYGGTHIYVCKSETVLRELRNQEIYDNFNGSNYRELAKKYSLCEKTVREIIAEKKLKIPDKQMSFF